MPLYTLAIQNAVDVRKLGQATSASQFFRQIGGAIGVAILGTVLATNLMTSLSANVPAGLTGADVGGLSADSGSLAGGVDLAQGIGEAGEVVAQAQRGVELAFADAVTRVYFYILFIVLVGWFVTLLVPELPLGRTIGRPRVAPATD
jgi:hypothetical protein